MAFESLLRTELSWVGIKNDGGAHSGGPLNSNVERQPSYKSNGDFGSNLLLTFAPASRFHFCS